MNQRRQRINIGRILTDTRPLRGYPAFRRLWLGHLVSQIGQQMAAITIAYQAYVLTKSSFAVGLVGLCGLLPLIAGGLYGGALVDAFDRRKIAIITACGMWASSALLVLQALYQLDSVLALYGLVALHSAFYSINSPARQAIVPRLLPVGLLPAGNALTTGSTNLGLTVGPMLGGVMIAWHGVTAAYALDAVTLAAALYAAYRLPSIRPGNGQAAKVPGLRSVIDGIRFLRTAANLRMTFILDMCAMVLAQPRSLFPALALTVYASNASVLGLLQAAPAVGALIAFVGSGWLGRVNRHGIAIAVAVAAYGLAIALAGFAVIALPGLIWLTVTLLALSGSADMISASYRQSVLQAAAPDELRGRMQGIFTVVVAGGPRLGDFLAGSFAELFGEGGAMVFGGLACLAGIAIALTRHPEFKGYDARRPSP